MITYTTLMGFTAGLGLILISCLGYKLFYKRQAIQSFEGWALSFVALGSILTLLSAHMTIMWPLQAPERFKNFVFGEPNFVLGVLLLLAGWFLWRRGEALLPALAADTKKADEARLRLLVVMQPVSWIVFALGLVLAACTVGAFQYEIFATAPAQEPILGTWSKDLVNASLCLLYAIPALASLCAPLVAYRQSRAAMAIMGSGWFLAGLGWLLVAVVVYYTHIAMDFNFRT